MVDGSLMHRAHMADTRAEVIFIHDRAPRALFGRLEMGPFSDAPNIRIDHLAHQFVEGRGGLPA